MKRARKVVGTLYARMAAAAGVAVVVVAGMAVITERGVFGEVAVERATAGSSALMALLQDEAGLSGTLDPVRVQAGLESLRAHSAANEQNAGRFISVVVYDASGTRLAGLEDSAAMDAIGGTPVRAAAGPDTGPPFWYSNPNGIPVVSLEVPVSKRDGTRVGTVDAVFAVSEAAVEDAKIRIARRVLLAVGVVALTTAIVCPIIAYLVRRLESAAEELLRGNLESIAALGSAIAKKDSDTDVHNYRVTIYAARLGEAVGLDRKAIRGLIKGALLHDVGKIGIRDAILLKRGRLDESEFAEMKKHVQYGLEIVEQSSWLKDARDVVGGHHEKFDGSGYHQGLRGADIPINARIFAIADVFDALTSRRPYKEPMSYEQALAILEKGSGTHFDPHLFGIFTGIAADLYWEFGNRDDDRPRAALRELVDLYFNVDEVALPV